MTLTDGEGITSAQMHTLESHDLDSSSNTKTRKHYNKTVIRKTYAIDIPIKTILRLVLVAVGVYVAYKLVSVFVVLFFAYILASAVLPLVGWFRKFVPKVLAIMLAYTVVLAVIIGLGVLLMAPVSAEISSFQADYPTLLDHTTRNLADIAVKLPFVDKSPEELQFQIAQYVNESLTKSKGTLINNQNLAHTITLVRNVLGSFFASMFFAFVLSVYMVWDHDAFLDVFLLKTFDTRRRKLIKSLILRVERKLGHWLIGQTVLSVIIGLLTWLLLTYLHVPFALPLAVIAGLLETVPSIGPVLSAVPAIMIVLATQDPDKVIFVTLGYIVIQQLENNFIVPRVLGTAVGVKPTIVILAIYIGFQLFGLAGAVLSVPIVALLDIFWEFKGDLEKLTVME